MLISIYTESEFVYINSQVLKNLLIIRDKNVYNLSSLIALSAY
jgi:hypothetical protein